MRINEQIKAKQIRLIGENGEQLGIVSSEEGLRQAEMRNLDLVEVAPEADPPVCRIMDYGKYRYEQEKREKEARKKMHLHHLKEIRLKPNIEEHDYQVKLRNLQKFLQYGDKVKITLIQRRREISHPEIGEKLLERFLNDANQWGEIEKPPKIEGRNIVAVLAPRHA
ncbi:MAG: translation initiation factor IF-3 [Candidatus Omnitrophica bacterium]|nr:translation initiation factor IF-3 [Candidatus Omnitrophota bacterium]MCM8798473.1 translation initiation factor IF-3 [Candidatus Omnitrophota bacterium]